METLTVSEYQQLRQKQLDKGELLVPLFMCSKGRQITIQSMKNLQKAYTATSLAFLGVCLFTNTPLKFSKHGLDSFIYGITAILNTINAYLLYKCKIGLPKLTLSIHWDMQNELFIVHRPKGLFGGIEQL